MGKRKKSSRKPQGPKKSESLPKLFTCLFCNHDTATVHMDKKAGVGTITCSNCAQDYQCSIHSLSDPVDVYGDWVDAADTVAREVQPGDGGGGFGGARQPGRGVTNKDADEELADDDEY